MIETAEGLDNVEAITAEGGLDGVYIGPSDLALALGLPPTGDNDTPEHAAAVERIALACRASGVPVGIHTGGLAYTQKYLEMGFNFVTLGSDGGFMMRAAREDLAALPDVIHRLVRSVVEERQDPTNGAGANTDRPRQPGLPWGSLVLSGVFAVGGISWLVAAMTPVWGGWLALGAGLGLLAGLSRRAAG